MGNSESSSGDAHDNIVNGSSEHKGYSAVADKRHQPLSSMDTSYRHEPPASASSSTIATSRRKHNKYIADNFNSLEEVVNALREEGLESSNLILGIDFTKSNEWTGKRSFNRRSLHAIGNIPNPYEQAISIIGRTLTPFDEDNLIPCFGFGDASTHDQHVFSFYPDHRPCNGFEEALARYREIVPHLKLSGPTSFAPVIDAAIDVVEKSNRQYHVLVIIADGQVTRSSDIPPGKLSPQERATINSIVEAKIVSKHTDMRKKEAAFALAALMEMPFQYRATLSLPHKDNFGVSRAKPLPPPLEVIEHDNVKSLSRPTSDEPVDPGPPGDHVCPICLTNAKDMAFGCGHMTCRECGVSIQSCPLCREPIRTRIRLYG